MAQRIQSNAPKPYTLLTKVKSESGSWEYEIRTSHRDGKTYCTCKGFTFNKHCKHMDAYNAKPSIAVPSAYHMPARAQARTPGDVLREELAMLGLTISASSANAISTRVLAAGGKVNAAGDGGAVMQEGVRVIILPD